MAIDNTPGIVYAEYKEQISWEETGHFVLRSVIGVRIPDPRQYTPNEEIARPDESNFVQYRIGDSDLSDGTVIVNSDNIDAYIDLMNQIKESYNG